VTHAENCRRGRLAKLTHEQAAEVRQLRCAGWRAGDIAEAYGIHQSTVYRIAKGTTWADA
jgi:DNA-directed RNA polymerase specialized sigma24 family protein